MSAMIWMRNIGKILPPRRNGRASLKGIDLTHEEGEYIWIMGASGVG